MQIQLTSILLAGLCQVLSAQNGSPPSQHEEQRATTSPVQAGREKVRLDLEALTRVRKAVGLTGSAWIHGIIVEGEALQFGIDHVYTLLCLPDGRFMKEMNSRLPSAAGFDGEIGWKVDWTGMSGDLEGSRLRQDQLFAGVCSGYWLDPRFPVEITGGHEVDGNLRFLLRNEEARGVVLVDSSTLLPKSYSWTTEGGDNEIRLSRYEQHNGASLPILIKGKIDSLAISLRATGFKVGKANTASLCAVRRERPDDTVFNGKLPATLKLKRAWTGHLFVEVQVDGGESCHFFLDSGAGSHCIDAAFAKKLGLASVGEVAAVGVGGTVKSQIVRAKTLRVGPYLQMNPVLVSLDLKSIARVLKVDAVGIVGYDFFARALVALDIEGATVHIDKPGAWKNRKAAWRRVFIRDNHPCIECAFEGDRSGLFRLDTGAGGTVVFHGGCVEEHQLLKGRKTKQATSGGVGGNIVVHAGILDWFEIASHRFERPMVRFAQSNKGVLGKADIAGNIGVGFLKPFVLLFDYPGRRLGFEKR